MSWFVRITVYSLIVVDLSEPIRITLPEIGGRYMSMHVVNQDHYMFVETKPGTSPVFAREIKPILNRRCGA